MTTIEDIIKTLPTLPDADRARVRAALGVLATAPSVPVGGVSGADWGIAIIADEMAAYGLEFRGVEALRRSTSFRTYTDKMKAVQSYIERATRHAGERRALFRLGVQLLISDCQRMGIPLGSTLIMRQIHRVPAMIDNAFPGYAEAGLLSLIFKRKQK